MYMYIYNIIEKEKEKERDRDCPPISRYAEFQKQLDIHVSLSRTLQGNEMIHQEERLLFLPYSLLSILPILNPKSPVITLMGILNLFYLFVLFVFEFTIYLFSSIQIRRRIASEHNPILRQIPGNGRHSKPGDFLVLLLHCYKLHLFH